MSIGIQSTTATSATQITDTSNWQQNKQKFQALNSALQSGDLSAAKDAYAALTQNKTVDPNSPLGKIGQALQSGDIQSAQQLEQKMHSGHHHGHSSAATASSSTTTSSGPISATVGNNVNEVV